jgi:rod shape-determining protein MreC
MRLAVWVLISLPLIMLDSHTEGLSWLRSGVALVFQPVRYFMSTPAEFGQEVGGFMIQHRDLQAENLALRAQRVEDAGRLQQLKVFKEENLRLRELAGLPLPAGRQHVIAEVVQTVRDPFSQRVLLNRGNREGLAAGQPVFDARGLIGQVIRTMPLSSEVLLITDPELGVPAQLARTGQRVLVFGEGASGLLEVRYVPASSDVRKGDRITTSGVDGVYPPGVPVAYVTRVERIANSPYLGVEAHPMAGPGSSRLVMIAISKPSAGDRR